MKQTAVEWLMEQITYDSSGERRSSFRETVDLKIYFEKAKEIEKQQMIEMHDKGFDYALKECKELNKK